MSFLFLSPLGLVSSLGFYEILKDYGILKVDEIPKVDGAPRVDIIPGTGKLDTDLFVAVSIARRATSRRRSRTSTGRCLRAARGQSTT